MLMFFRTHTAAASMRSPCLNDLSTSNEASDRGLFLPIGQKSLFIRGPVRVALLNLSVCLFVCLSVCLSVCATFVFFTGCESCTRPISTKPGSTEAGEYRITRGTYVVARRLGVVAVAGLLWISWCVSSAVGFHTRPAVSMRPPCLIYLSTSKEVVGRRWS